MMRLQKYIAMSGLCSRRRAEELIRGGEISVNGVKVTEMGFKIDGDRDEVRHGNKLIAPEKKEYFLLNKPVGYTCTLADLHAEKKVTELISSRARLFSVGRLDRDSEGLLILTNDGDFAQRVIHPKQSVPKVYEAKLFKPLSDLACDQLRRGLPLDGKIAAIAELNLVAGEKKFYKIVIYQGRKRQIRRLIEQVGNRVVYLRRVRIGGLVLGGLAVGEYRSLTAAEIAMF